MRDVAALAGVGLKTVSRVVNDEPNVSGDTRERVQRAIRELGFAPNHGAGSLRREGGRRAERQRHRGDSGPSTCHLALREHEWDRWGER